LDSYDKCSIVDTILSTCSETSQCSYKVKDTFQGKNVLLTGASGGLGMAFALYLASCYVKSLVLSGRNTRLLESLAKACLDIQTRNDAKSKIRVYVIPCDLVNHNSVFNLGKKSLRLCDGIIDVLVNNGGVSSRSKFLDTNLNVDELLMKINYLAGAALSKIVVPNMVKQASGMVIWISSIQGLIGTPFRTSYAASKFAVQGYCEALRPELKSSGVSVHIASPGYICTNLSKSAVKGNGEIYGQMDETTLNGESPLTVALDILDKVARGRTDFIVAATISARLAILLHNFFPWMLYFILEKRYCNLERKKIPNQK